ncbi:MAG: FAD-dependent oxidoreductase [Pseudomonadota bacterium]
METLAADLRTMVRTPLTDEHVTAMRRAGRVEMFEAGREVISVGVPAHQFIYVLSGEVEAYNPATGERYGIATLGPGQFAGEISFLNGGSAMLSMRTCVDSELLIVERETMLELMARIPEASDIIVTVMAARRRRLLESNESALHLIGDEADRSLRRLAAFASRNRIPYRRKTPDQEDAQKMAEACNIDLSRPGVVFGETRVDDPSPRAVARLLGLDLALDPETVHDVLIVGGGPAGVAAAVYAGAEGLSALVLEDLAIGGQAGTSSRIENYMGFPTGISGADLVWRGEVQAMKFGTRFAVPRRATALEVSENGENFCVTLDDGDMTQARALVIATGVQYRRLPLPRLAEFEGAGVYYAATEVEARWCRASEVAVIGGGNSAGQAAMFLSRSAKHVHLLVRGPSLASSMSSYLSSRLEADPRITIHYRTEVTELHGDSALTCINIRDKMMGQDWRLDTRALFVMVGAAPNTDWLSGHVALDEKGFVQTGQTVGASSAYATSTPGIFAVGDVRAGSVKRVASAVGEGSVVISRAWDWLNR